MKKSCAKCWALSFIGIPRKWLCILNYDTEIIYNNDRYYHHKYRGFPNIKPKYKCPKPLRYKDLLKEQFKRMKH